MANSPRRTVDSGAAAPVWVLEQSLSGTSPCDHYKIVQMVSLLGMAISKSTER